MLSPGVLYTIAEAGGAGRDEYSVTMMVYSFFKSLESQITLITQIALIILSASPVQHV